MNSNCKYILVILCALFIFFGQTKVNANRHEPQKIDGAVSLPQANTIQDSKNKKFLTPTTMAVAGFVALGLGFYTYRHKKGSWNIAKLLNRSNQQEVNQPLVVLNPTHTSSAVNNSNSSVPMGSNDQHNLIDASKPQTESNASKIATQVLKNIEDHKSKSQLMQNDNQATSNISPTIAPTKANNHNNEPPDIYEIADAHPGSYGSSLLAKEAVKNARNDT
jgi:hypothetical protein